MKTFAKVIAASAGVVLLLFVLVGGLAYWSDDDIPAAIAHLDTAPPTPTLAPPPTAPAPQPERIATPSAPTKPQPSPAPTIKVKRQTPAPAAPTKAKKKAAVETMSHEEYLAREMHYIEKIQKDAEAVLERAAEERQKVAALEAQLDVLLFP